MNWFSRLCLCGLIGSLLLWILPSGMKYYHLYRSHDEYKILFEEHTSEYGLGTNGFIIAHHVDVFEVMPYTGMNGKSLNPVREEWYKTGCQDRTPWPVNSNRIIWDDWGPNHTYRPDGVRVTQFGTVYCLPYSVVAIGCFVLLAAQSGFQWTCRKARQRPAPG